LTAASRPDGNYGIQVGASRSYRGAKRSIRQAKRALPNKLEAGTHARILKPSSYRGRLYRARIVGMSRTEAKQACRILKREDVRCMTFRQHG